MSKSKKLPDITWIEWVRHAVSNLGNNWAGGPSAEHYGQAAKALLEAEAAWAATGTPAAPERHLWDYDHPYIGPECSDPGEFESWSDFLEEEGEMDPDYNLLFRWDWIKRPDDWEDDYDEEPPEHCLHLFYVLQRKGLVRSTTVAVSADDEPAIRAWLAVRLAYLGRVNEGVLHV